jgi:hypothetical protein
VLTHALLDGVDEPHLGQLLEQRRGLIPHIEEVAVAALLLLLRAQQLDQDLCLAAGELIEGVAVCRQIDQTKIREPLGRLSTDE